MKQETLVVREYRGMQEGWGEGECEGGEIDVCRGEHVECRSARG